MIFNENAKKRITRVINAPINKHMQEFFSFVQQESDGTITEAVLRKIHTNFLKGVFERVSYKGKDVSETIDVIRSKFVKNRLLLKGTTLVMKASILKIVGVEDSKGELVGLEEKDIQYCESMIIPCLSTQESGVFVKTRQM